MAEKNDNEPPTVDKRLGSVAMGARGVNLTNLDDAFRFAKAIQQAGIFATKFRSEQQILVAIQLGLEVGLPPIMALKTIAIINGIPSIYGEALPALAWSSGVVADLDEWYEIAGRRLSAEEESEDITDDWVAVCMTKRRGQVREVVRRFSVEDAKRAGLWGKTTSTSHPTPWVLYPKRMLRHRARHYCFKDNLPDVLAGLTLDDEAREVSAREVAEPRTDPAQTSGDMLDLVLESGGSLMLDRLLETGGCLTGEDKDLVVAWASRQKGNGLAKYQTYQQCISDAGSSFVLAGIHAALKHGARETDLLEVARREMT